MYLDCYPNIIKNYFHILYVNVQQNTNVYNIISHVIITMEIYIISRNSSSEDYIIQRWQLETNVKLHFTILVFFAITIIFGFNLNITS